LNNKPTDTLSVKRAGQRYAKTPWKRTSDKTVCEGRVVLYRAMTLTDDNDTSVIRSRTTMKVRGWDSHEADSSQPSVGFPNWKEISEPQGTLGKYCGLHTGFLWFTVCHLSPPFYIVHNIFNFFCVVDIHATQSYQFIFDIWKWNGLTTFSCFYPPAYGSGGTTCWIISKYFL